MGEHHDEHGSNSGLGPVFVLGLMAVLVVLFLGNFMSDEGHDGHDSHHGGITQSEVDALKTKFQAELSAKDDQIASLQEQLENTQSNLSNTKATLVETDTRLEKVRQLLEKDAAIVTE